jgi:hypothetical protein
MKRLVLLAPLIAFISLPSFAQAPPCLNGTLATVIGTSCTIGNLTFNFQNNFQGFVQTTDLATNTITTVPLTADAIGFTPIKSGNQAGFLLTTNFVDDANGTGLFFSGHQAHFSYSEQVNGAFEIFGESSTIAGNITQVNTANISAIDDQCYTNGQCSQVAPAINFNPGIGLFSSPSVSTTLGVPALAGTGAGRMPSFTTAVDSFAFLGGQAILDSTTFLYTVVPQAPPPPLAKLRYKSIDLPGVQATFASAINNRGQIAGTVQDFSGVFHGYVTEPDANGFTTVDFPGAALTSAVGLNDRGDIVGQYGDSAGVTHGFLLKDGNFRTVDFPSSIFNVAASINDKGDIAGFYQNADFSIHSYLLDDGSFTTIDDPDAFVFNGPGNIPFTVTEIFALNDRGHFAGFSLDANGLGQSFLLSLKVFHRIKVPAGVQGTFAFGLNDTDDVVGDFTDIFGVTHGFLLTEGVLKRVDFPHGTNTFPSWINSPQRIVGTYTDSTGATHSFLAENRNPADSDIDGDDHAAAPQDGAQNGAALLRQNAPARPCIGRQPVQPNPTNGRLSCKSPL